jgi:polyphosphate kinase 2 (PPK2 family)
VIAFLLRETGHAMANDQTASSRVKRKDYEKELRKLQVQLCHLQDWVKEKKLRVIVLFEGRDAAGKGGTARDAQLRIGNDECCWWSLRTDMIRTSETLN